MTNKSKTIRFRCADCQTYIGMHPEGFPILALNPALADGLDVGPVSARHSLKHCGTGELHSQMVSACQQAGDGVAVMEKQFAPCCSFLCPVICAKTCCALCCGSQAAALTGVKANSVTEVACPEATEMTPATVVATRS